MKMIADVLSGKRDWCIAQGDSLQLLREMPDGYVQCAVTSPPYYSLKDYEAPGQIGLEETPDIYVQRLVEIFAELRRVLRDDGTLWLNIGDSYSGSGGAHTDKQGNPGISRSFFRNGVPKFGCEIGRPIAYVPPGLKPKDLMGIPWKMAFALQADGWYWRQWCPWIKRNTFPDSATDRPGVACEVILYFSKNEMCYYDREAVRKINDRKSGKSDSFKRQVSEQPFNAPKQHRQDRQDKKYGGGHYRRNSDWFFESWQGMFTDDDGDPLAFVVNTKGFKGPHYATFPPSLVEPCILASSRLGDVILDPFSGMGTTVMVALRHERRGIGLELNPEYVKMSERRIVNDNPLMNGYAQGR